MNNKTRLALVEVFKNEMGIDPELVAQEGANSDGYRTFLAVPRLHDEKGRKLSRFVKWSDEQYEVIEKHLDLFHDWFSEED